MKATKAQLTNWALLLYFLIPYFIFIFFFGWKLDFDFSETLWALKNSFLQAGIAAFASLLLAVPLSLGLQKAPVSARKSFRVFLLLPQIMPSLFSLLIAFSILNPFPMGSTGIIFTYVLVNAGLAAVLLDQAVRANLGNLANVAEIYSLGRITFFTRIYLPLLKKDMASILFLIFAFCLANFSIPLIAGGGRGTNLEVLIYEKIYLLQDWKTAFSLCLLQTLLVLLIGKFAVAKADASAIPFTEGRYLKSAAGLILLYGYLTIYFGGYFAGLLKAHSTWDFFIKYSEDLIPVTLFSLKALMAYLVLNMALLSAWLLGFIGTRSFSPAHNLISVSTVVVGFAVYLGFPADKDYDLLKMTLAMSFILFPVLFKLFLQKRVEGLQRQIDIALIYGVSKFSILLNVIFRQLKGALLLWLSVLVLWFLSDFAILKSVGVQQQTLGLLSESFLSSYRFGLSYLMSVYIILISVIFVSSLYLILRLANVIYKKSAL